LQPPQLPQLPQRAQPLQPEIVLSAKANSYFLAKVAFNAVIIAALVYSFYFCDYIYDSMGVKVWGKI